MSKEKISVQELVDLMVVGRMITKKSADEFIKVFLSTIEDALMNGEPVKVKGLGTFKSQWNEPRKSVNVNTGEEIIIDGYYRTVFIPENELRDSINEPFSHLEPIVLENDVEKIDKKLEEDELFEIQNPIEEALPIEPLRIFEEQAEEIKSLLNDINSLSEKKTVDCEPEMLEDELVVIHPKQPPLKDIAASDSFVDKKLIVQEKFKSHIQELDDFDTLRDLSLLIPEAVVSEEKNETSDDKVACTEMAKEDLVESEEFVEKKEDVSTISDAENDVRVGDIEDEDFDNLEDRIDDDKEELDDLEEDDKFDENNLLGNEIISEETVALNAVVSDATMIEAGKKVEKNTEKRTVAKTPNTADNEIIPTILDEDFTKNKRKRYRNILIIVFILAALVVIVWFLFSLRKSSDIKVNQKRVESIADSTARVLKVKAIADSLATLDNNVNVDSTTRLSDTLQTKTVDPVVKNMNSRRSTADVLNSPRTYTRFIATEKMVVGSQLTKFAKQYYGHPNFWVYIYEANKDKISDPNNVPAGTDIKIPKMDPRLIDVGNVECLNYAKKLQSDYLQ